MNNAEAKFLLHAYRPNGADAGDATFCAAVEHATQDPALKEWFARQQAFDGQIGAKLQEVAPPPGLRAAILAGGRVSGPKIATGSLWRRPVWLAAASLAVAGALSLLVWPKEASSLELFAVRDAKLGAIHGHGDRGPTTNALQWALSQPELRLGQKLPVNFSALHDSGCRVVNYRGHELLEVCFNRNGSWFHCYIGRRSDFAGQAENSPPVLHDEGGVAVARWANDEQVVMIVTAAGQRALQSLL